MENTNSSRPPSRAVSPRPYSRQCGCHGCDEAPTERLPARSHGDDAASCLYPRRLRGEARRRSQFVATLLERVLRFVSSFGLLRRGWYLLLGAQVAIVQRRFTQQSDKDQRAYTTPGDQQETVVNAQAVSLQTQPGPNQINGTPSCGG